MKQVHLFWKVKSVYKLKINVRYLIYDILRNTVKRFKKEFYMNSEAILQFNNSLYLFNKTLRGDHK